MTASSFGTASPGLPPASSRTAPPKVIVFYQRCEQLGQSRLLPIVLFLDEHGINMFNECDVFMDEPGVVQLFTSASEISGRP